MLRPRIIPSLLVHNGGLVKTVQFANPKYVGDPINAVRIFNEKEVDELIVLDIDASARQREPDYKMISDIAAECRMPLCYGGGVKSVDQAVRIIKSGVEKVAVSSAAMDSPRLVTEIAEYVGTQSVVVVLDVKRNWRGAYEVWTHNATRNAKVDPVEMAKRFQDLGAGEITLNSIDNDGVMKGYDLQLARRVREAVHVPMTILGGAGSLSDIEKAFMELGTVGAAAGSLFVFKGIYRAVLINYPGATEKQSLAKAASKWIG